MYYGNMELYKVTNNLNSGPGSLREAIIKAISASVFVTIEIVDSVVSPIILLSELPSLTSNLSILGPTDHSITIKSKNSMSLKNNLFSIFTVGDEHNKYTITLSNLVISGGIYNMGQITIINSTIVDNSNIGNGGGIYNKNNAIITIGNSVVANNNAIHNKDVTGSFSSSGNNLIGHIGDATGFNSTDLLNDKPDLLPLGNYGGPTQTCYPKNFSPLINNGSINAMINFEKNNKISINTDQRGFPRTTNNKIDIGSVQTKNINCFFQSSLLIRSSFKELISRHLFMSINIIFGIN